MIGSPRVVRTLGERLGKAHAFFTLPATILIAGALFYVLNNPRFSARIMPASAADRLAGVVRCGSGIEHHIALDADLLDQIKLALEEIDMFLLARQDHLQQVTGDEIA